MHQLINWIFMLSFQRLLKEGALKCLLSNTTNQLTKSLRVGSIVIVWSTTSIPPLFFPMAKCVCVCFSSVAYSLHALKVQSFSTVSHPLCVCVCVCCKITRQNMQQSVISWKVSLVASLVFVHQWTKALLRPFPSEEVLCIYLKLSEII